MKQYRDVSEFINSEPGLYIAGRNDCYDFANEALARLNIGGVRTSDIIKFNLSDRVTLARVDRALDSGVKMAYGFSAEQISKIYNVSLNRVETICLDEQTGLILFRIKPYDESTK